MPTFRRATHLTRELEGKLKRNRMMMMFVVLTLAGAGCALEMRPESKWQVLKDYLQTRDLPGLDEKVKAAVRAYSEACNSRATNEEREDLLRTAETAVRNYNSIADQYNKAARSYLPDEKVEKLAKNDGFVLKPQWPRYEDNIPKCKR